MMRASLSPRLLLLAAALVALAVLFIQDARPAHAQQPGAAVWSATLEVRDLNFGWTGCNDGNGAATCEPGGALTDDDFRFLGTDYEIESLQLYADSDELDLEFNRHVSPEHRAHLTLHVGDWAFPLADTKWKSSAPNAAPNLRDFGEWDVPHLWWSVSQQLPVRLTYDPPVWWAILTVQTKQVGALVTFAGCSNVNTEEITLHCGPSGALPDDEFRFRGRGYEVLWLQIDALFDALSLSTVEHLSPDARAALRLRIRNKEFPLASARASSLNEVSAPDVRNDFVWGKPGLTTWTQGEEVLVRLTDDSQTETTLWSSTFRPPELGDQGTSTLYIWRS